ncbi:MAG: carboxypeptidase-like regulatory domain-containing protein [Ferruginibacter sp.]
MKRTAFSKATASLLLLAFHQNIVAQDRAQDHNSSRSNKTASRSLPANAWQFALGSGASFAVKSNEGSLFRGNSIATKMSGQYNFGTVGLGFNSGMMPGTVNNAAISSFLTERKFPADAIISSTRALNAYVLFGPTFSFGKQVMVNAQLGGGMFYNNAGSVNIGQQGATRALYRFDAGTKNLFPGAGGSIQLAYPVNKSTRFFINTDYLQTKSSIRLFDPQRGIDVPVEQNRDVKMFTAGVGIVKSFGKEQQRVLPTVNKKEITIDEGGVHVTKRVLPTVNKKEITIDEGGVHVAGRVLPTVNKKEITIDESGVHVTQRILPTVNKKDITIDESGVHVTGRVLPTVNKREASESCGPVTLKITSPDGTVEERTFSCPNDAADYAKQTQGSSFGEKVNQGLHAAGSAISQGAGRQQSNIIHRDLAARNIIAGIISWNNGSSNGIVTNRSAESGAAAASYAATGRSINSPAGISTILHTRESGSGMATGRRQYQPVFTEDNTGDCNGCNVKVQSNPLYQDKGLNGSNPLHKSASGNTNSCPGVPGLKVYLVDAGADAVVASSTTEACGEFYFANVPDGNYIVKVSGNMALKKSYDVSLTAGSKTDLAGEILAADDFWSVEIITAEGTAQQAAALIKTKTKSNQSNDRTSATQPDLEAGMLSAVINTSRSNIKNQRVATGDLDGDGISEILVGNGTGDGVMLSPGSPIGGLSIKGGKNPGGNLRTTSTNMYGEFEFTGMDAGSYTIEAALNYVIADETAVSVGADFIGENINTTESNLKDIPPVMNRDENENPQQKAGISTSRSNIRNRAAAVTGQEQNIVTSESNLKGITKITASQNSQSLKTGNLNTMPNRISMNVTVPKQTQGATFGEKVNAGMSSGPGMRAQNNNTVRSNRTDNAIVMADLDGDGAMESSVMNFSGEVATLNITEPGTRSAGKKATSGLKDVLKTQVRAVPFPPKWTASDASLARVHGDPHVDEKDGTLKFQGSNIPPVAKGSWQSTAVAVKQVNYNNAVCAIITGSPDDFPGATAISLNGLPPGEPVVKAAVWFTDDKGNTYSGETDQNGRISLNGLPPWQPMRMMMNLACNGTDDIIVVFSSDETGSAISNVLKTKHDTAKNAISNIR